MSQCPASPSSLSRRELLKSAAGVTAIGLPLTSSGDRDPTASVPASISNEDSARVTVSSVRRIFHNGEHNAFTHLCRYRGQLYLTFRSCPDGHMVHPTASIRVLRSPAGEKWDAVHRFRVEQRDTRDPHFLLFRAKLSVCTRR